MKCVVDCNIWVMAISSRSPYYPLITFLAAGKFTLVVSNEILLEYEEILTAKYGHETCLRFLMFLHQLDFVIFKETFFNWNLIKSDQDDNKYSDCYIAGAADYLVTQDKHFKVLSKVVFPKINVISIDDLMSMLSTL